MLLVYPYWKSSSHTSEQWEQTNYPPLILLSIKISFTMYGMLEWACTKLLHTTTTHTNTKYRGRRSCVGFYDYGRYRAPEIKVMRLSNTNILIGVSFAWSSHMRCSCVGFIIMGDRAPEIKVMWLSNTNILEVLVLHGQAIHSALWFDTSERYDTKIFK